MNSDLVWDFADSVLIEAVNGNMKVSLVSTTATPTRNVKFSDSICLLAPHKLLLLEYEQ